MTNRLVGLLFALGFLLLPCENQARDNPAETRPRVALVLGGGGAHAIANVGVLKELERQRVPIDLVVGTGLGSMIGGLYASGMSPDEIEDFFLSTDWADVFDPDTRREDLSFRRKRDDQDFLIKYRVGIKDGQAQLPTATVPNDKLGRLLQTAVANTKSTANFDALPIAFRAVGMDLLNGDEVVLKSGSLDRAMLAALTAPGTLPPVEIDGRLLVTGSLLNNLPVDVARDWGADIVIVVDVGSYTATADGLNSVFGIVDQVTHLLQQHSSAESLATLTASDIVVRPDVGPARETDFSALRHWIEQGEKAVADYSDNLAGVRLGEQVFASLIEDRSSRRSTDPVITEIRLDNGSDVDDERILALLEQPIGQPLDEQQLDADIRKIHGLGAFSSVDFSLHREGPSAVLEVHTMANRAGARFWRFGLSMQDDLEGNSAYTASASMTWTQLNRLGGEWRNVFRLGDRQQVSTQFYQPLDRLGRYFVSTSGNFVERNVNSIDDGDIVAQFRVQETTGLLSFGRIIGNSGELQVGLIRGTGTTSSNIGSNFPSADFDLGGLSASATYDTLDNIYFPKRGTRAGLAWTGQRESLGSSIDVDIASGRMTAVKTWDAHTLLGTLDIQTQLDDAAGVQNLVSLGGLFRLSGYRRDELSGRHAAVGRLIYYRQIRSNPLRGLLEASLYLGGSIELGNVWQDSDDISLDNSIAAGSLFLGADTFVGPIYFAAGLAEDGKSAMYLYIGRPF